VALSIALQLDMLLGAFTAGVVVRLVLGGATPEDRGVVETKLEAIRGVSGLCTAPPGASGADRRAIVLLSATGLPIIVAVTAIGTTTGDLARGIAAALVGAGMLSVLVFPLLALGQRRRQPSP